MERVPEAELMIDPQQARAYADADFDLPHGRFIALLAARWPDLPQLGVALDLGCGPGDIGLRFARAFPGWHVDGVDASPAMLALARAAAERAGLAQRVALHLRHLPADGAPGAGYDLVFSNSLLHHLTDPAILWSWLLARLAPGTRVFVMDLMRPDSAAAARALVERYAVREPEVLRTDFYNSLRAAYRLDEVRAQLQTARLPFDVAVVSDRHLIASGAIPAGR